MNLLPAKYYSHGKLLLTGEYLVMFGAKSLAVPVNFGQSMLVEENCTKKLNWKAYIQNEEWFIAELLLPDLEVLTACDRNKVLFLTKVLNEARNINPYFLNTDKGFEVTTRLDYPQQWGLGSSSTLISNIAKWAEIDAMQLNKNISEGSGYDIACATADGPILYQLKNDLPYWSHVTFFPAFRNQLYFVFLGKKQDTSNSIIHFKKNYQFHPSDVTYISTLTMQLLHAGTLEKAILTIDRHESFLSALLGIETVKNTFFDDFHGSIKSLGAWGGDFALVASEKTFDEVKRYFNSKGFNTVLKFEEMVLQPDIPSFIFAQDGIQNNSGPM